MTPFVCIRCMTYNHAPYIEDAMRGFCMQKTTFPFVAIIVDDASTDGEPGVIHEFLKAQFDMANARKWETVDAHFIEARHKENLNCWFAVVYLKYNFYRLKKTKDSLLSEWEDNATYISLCEGDDYWIDSKKLQLQVDFLIEHPDFSMCYSGFDTVDDKKRLIFRPNYEKAMKMSRSGNILPDLLITNFILTCTTVFKREVFEDYLQLRFKYGHDYTLFLFAAIYGKCYFFKQHFAAYRKTPTGAMATKGNEIGKWFHETRLFFYEGLLDGSFQGKCSYHVISTIAKYCYFESNEEYKQKYNRILKQNKCLWIFLPFLYLKKVYSLIRMNKNE